MFVVVVVVCFVWFVCFDVLSDAGLAPGLPQCISIEGGRQIKEKVL